MDDVSTMYASMVFNDSVMRERLPKDIYRALHRTIITGQHFDLDVANAVACAMKEWAVEKGATHFTHWFQPMTGITAEKHDSFISPQPDGRVIMDFSGKELVKGEPDASSFPSGGLRATFEARGYTAWDPTSYAFIKDGTLYIPTAFCSYGGEALDKKTPLLRSMEALDHEAKRVLALFGEKPERVVATVGAEQEYFLIDKSLFSRRPDLVFTGRTLLGARPPKGQEMDDHYFGSIKPRVAAFMKEVDRQLWILGVPAKTKHNEVAPAQHELAAVFSICNVAADQNQLTMDVLKSTADKFDLVCLLHEKPFAGVNGSGKHNNWSLATSEGENLLEPTACAARNTRFLLFLTAVIKAVDEYADILRVSVASAGNDHRLGANEAPPAIVSMFLGKELTDVLSSIISSTKTADKKNVSLDTGAAVLPNFVRDNTDRNRTSPFAFTGNKFEFRMLGSSASIAGANIVLNTIVAQSLSHFADHLQNSTNLEKDVFALIKQTLKKHIKIVFNGNNYSQDWVEQAKELALPNLASTVDALPLMIEQKNIDVFTKHKVYSKAEILARYEIHLESYSKTLHIEAMTMVDMVKKEIIPCAIEYQNSLSNAITAKKTAVGDILLEPEVSILNKLAKLCGCIYSRLSELENSLVEAKQIQKPLALAQFFRQNVFVSMVSLRIVVDELETLMPAKLFPYPSYADLLYSVK